MAVFQYEARNAEGRHTCGNIVAGDPSQAAALLRQQGLFPGRIDRLSGRAAQQAERELLYTQPPAAGAMAMPAGASEPTLQGQSLSQAAPNQPYRVAPAPYFPGGVAAPSGAAQPVAGVAPAGTAIAQPCGGPVQTAGKVGPQHLALMYNQLGTMLNAGMGLHSALHSLSNSTHTPSARLQRVARDLTQCVLGGSTLSAAMLRYPHIFRPMQHRMVEAGEASGRLAEIMLRLSMYLQQEFEVRQEVSHRTLYPKLVLGLLLLVWPMSVPLSIGSYLAGLFGTILFVLTIAFVLWLLVKLLNSTDAGRDLWDRIKLAVPVVGPMVRKFTAARFARAFSALYRAGVPVDRAISMAGEAGATYDIRRASERIIPAIQSGAPLSQSLSATGYFPPIFMGMVSTGEQTGNLDGMLDKAAEYMENEARTTLTKLVIALGTGVLLFAAILVAVKMAMFYLGYIGGVMSGYGNLGE